MYEQTHFLHAPMCIKAIGMQANEKNMFFTDQVYYAVMLLIAHYFVGFQDVFVRFFLM